MKYIDICNKTTTPSAKMAEGVSLYALKRSLVIFNEIRLMHKTKDKNCMRFASLIYM